MSVLELLVDSPAALALGRAILHFVWQGAAVGLAVAVARAMLPDRANARYCAGCAGLAVMLAAFAATFVVSLPAPVSTPLTAVPDGPVRFLPAAGRDGATQWERAQAWLPWLAPLWMAGVSLLWLRLLGGWFAARRLARAGAHPMAEVWRRRVAELALRLRVSRPVLALESCVAEAPVVLGALRPAIVVPISMLTSLPPAQIEAVLAHELGHIRRWDYLANLLQSMIEGLLFYHPAVWWVSAKVRADREACCDDIAVEACGDAREYAAALAALEQWRLEPALAATGGDLMQRISRLLRQPEQPRTAAAPVLAVLICLLAGGVALAGWQQPPPPPPEAPPPPPVARTARPAKAPLAAQPAIPARVPLPAPPADAPPPPPPPKRSLAMPPAEAPPPPPPPRAAQPGVPLEDEVSAPALAPPVAPAEPLAPAEAEAPAPLAPLAEEPEASAAPVVAPLLPPLPPPARRVAGTPQPPPRPARTPRPAAAPTPAIAPEAQPAPAAPASPETPEVIGGVIGGVPGGVSGGITGTITGGISAGPVGGVIGGVVGGVVGGSPVAARPLRGGLYLGEAARTPSPEATPRARPSPARVATPAPDPMITPAPATQPAPSATPRTSSPALNGTADGFALVTPNGSYLNGTVDTREVAQVRGRAGSGSYIWTRRGGTTYVIHDAGTVNSARERLFRPAEPGEADAARSERADQPMPPRTEDAFALPAGKAQRGKAGAATWDLIDKAIQQGLAQPIPPEQ